MKFVYSLGDEEESPRYFSSARKAAEELVKMARRAGLKDGCVIEHEVGLDGELVESALVIWKGELVPLQGLVHVAEKKNAARSHTVGSVRPNLLGAGEALCGVVLPLHSTSMYIEIGA